MGESCGRGGSMWEGGQRRKEVKGAQGSSEKIRRVKKYTKTSQHVFKASHKQAIERLDNDARCYVLFKIVLLSSANKGMSLFTPDSANQKIRHKHRLTTSFASPSAQTGSRESCGVSKDVLERRDNFSVLLDEDSVFCEKVKKKVRKGKVE